jgi:hypothetical protein
MDSEKLAIGTMVGAILCALAAVIAPWVVRIFSRGAAGIVAVVLAAAATVLFLISNSNMPARYNIRPDLCFTPLLLLGAWLQGIVLGVRAIWKESDQSPVDEQNTQ